MKNKLSITILLAIILVSCSPTDTNKLNSNSILVSEIIQTTPDGERKLDYEYNGNKLVKITEYCNNTFIGLAYISYYGDLISKSEIYNSNNVLVRQKTFNYNINDNLASFIEIDLSQNTGDRVVYTYNSNGNVTYNHYEGDAQNQHSLTSNGIINFSNGEVSSHIKNQGNYTTTHYFTYDNKNSPFKNVLGVNKISYAEVGGFDSEINHNIIQIKQVFGSSNFITDIIINYNLDNYPITTTEPYVVTQYFY